MSDADQKAVDAYIAGFPPAVRTLLNRMRSTIRKAAPDAKEKIAYGIPTFTLSGNLVHFAGFTSHIGFYPGSQGIASFKQDLSRYKSGKGSVQFPLGEPLPLEVVRRIVRFRVKQNQSKRK